MCCLPLLLVAACTWSGCKSGSQPQASNTFKIGVITSLTGPAAALGQAHENGYTAALNDLSAKGGVLGKKIGQRGVTVLIVEQNVVDGLSISNRGYVVENGAVELGIGTSARNLLRSERLRSACLGL